MTPAEKDILVRLIELQLETWELLHKLAKKRVPALVLSHLGLDVVMKKLEEQKELLARLKRGV